MSILNETRRVINEFSLDRRRFHEVSEPEYADIIKRIETIFVAAGGLHRCWDGRLKMKRSVMDVSGNSLWYHALSGMIPDEPVYLLLEDTKGYEPVYRLYEVCLPELINMLDEINGLDEFYIASKRYKWLICAPHEDIVLYAGEISVKPIDKCDIL